jgi:hypothetical protein
MKAFHLSGLLLLAAVGASSAQMPTGDEMFRATASAQARARAAGLQLRSGSLWLTALRERTPMVAAYGAGICHLGYSAYTPGRDYRWLFPPLPPPQRELWLSAVVQHELAHCAEQASSADRQTGARQDTLAEGVGGVRWREVLADLAFAVQVDSQGADGEPLIRQLAALRAEHRDHDPAHDTSAELLCYLAARKPEARNDLDWLEMLKTWRARCFETRG